MTFKPVRYRAISLAIVAVSGLLGACATGQPALTSTSLPIVDISVGQAQIDESLPILADGTHRLSDENAGTKAVRWGGTIARIENLPEQITLLEVVSRPLHRNGRPVHNDKTSGRFVTLIQEFLDPEIVKAGRDITVIGALVTRQSGQIGQTDYVFPVVEAESYTYWKKQLAKAPQHFPHWNTYPGYYRDPLWAPWILYRPPPR